MAKAQEDYPSTLTARQFIPDPWDYHAPGSISTWEFYGFHDHLNRNPALTAWRAAYWDAQGRMAIGQGNQRLGTLTRSWSGTDFTTKEIVDFVLIPREEMTWRMLAEAFNGAGRLICTVRKQFQFMVLAEGFEGEVGFGDTTMRRSIDSGHHLDNRTSRSITLDQATGSVAHPPKVNSTALVAIDDPFIWHNNNMVSTWIFFGYSGHLEYNAAAAAARLAFIEAIAHPPNQLIGTEQRVWTGTYLDAPAVDFVLFARPSMTWKMLAEGMTGAQMVFYGHRECRFSVTLGDITQLVGLGQIKESAPGRGVDMNRATGSNTTRPTDLAEQFSQVRAKASQLHVATIHDPYTRHDPDMITTWEYFGFHGSLNAGACSTAWLELFFGVMAKADDGRSADRIGTKTMHWPVRYDNDWVDLVVIPGEAMTWRMLGEGVVGGVAVCAATAKEFQFGLVVDGIEGPVGQGQMKRRNNGAATA
ncbi:MAG: hypothetical protein Q9213_001232 [Squamulea squamosa]